MKTHIYGFDYEIVSTESALLAVRDSYTFHEIDDPDARPESEQIWWRVAQLGVNDRETMWMNNMDGEILIITDGPESYYRIF